MKANKTDANDAEGRRIWYVPSGTGKSRSKVVAPYSRKRLSLQLRFSFEMSAARLSLVSASSE